MLTALQLATLAIVDEPLKFQWSVQGFGVLRLFIKDVGRLHIWDRALRYPGVSLIHNHSWNLESTIVAGELCNTRYVESRPATGLALTLDMPATHWKRRLLTGYQSKMTEAPAEMVNLRRRHSEFYRPGDVYSQRADEIHQTDALDGTITIMRRDEDVNGHADVYWPLGTEWGTAIPRRATPAEVAQTTQRALPWLRLVTRR